MRGSLSFVIDSFFHACMGGSFLSGTAFRASDHTRREGRGKVGRHLCFLPRLECAPSWRLGRLPFPEVLLFGRGRGRCDFLLPAEERAGFVSDVPEVLEHGDDEGPDEEDSEDPDVFISVLLRLGAGLVGRPGVVANVDPVRHRDLVGPVDPFPDLRLRDEVRRHREVRRRWLRRPQRNRQRHVRQRGPSHGRPPRLLGHLERPATGEERHEDHLRWWWQHHHP
mmetsp:Transcript_37563/g.120502  ORF Transcript_37563/g.120502 Transcript_37563/m.120502 type:complete len:224 (+) Transcript_37563:2-673(+)